MQGVTLLCHSEVCALSDAIGMFFEVHVSVLVQKESADMFVVFCTND